MQPNSILAIAPSFNSYSSSNRFAEIAAKVIREISIEEEEQEEESESESENPSTSNSAEGGDDGAGADTNAADDDENDDFEFTFVCQDPDASPISADEIFSNGQIRPIYPIFKRDLILEDNDDRKMKNLSPSIRLPLRKLLIDGQEPLISSTSSSSESETVNGIPGGNYCVWTPKSMPPATPDRCKKSNSTGSSKRWRFRDLLHRSSSDGKETFVFLSTAAIKRGEKEKEKEKEKGLLKEKSKASTTSSSSSSGKGKPVSAHEMHYVTNRAMRDGDRRRSYLPYRKDIVGFFANVNGLSKTLHPF